MDEFRERPFFCEDGLLRIVSEQSPNPDSRITIGPDIDRFGLSSPVLHWQLSEIDKHTIRQAVIRFGEAFAESGLGRVRIANWLLYDDIELPGIAEAQVGGHHHMCTTRMASTPREGVVDANQKVFGINNLYISGPSVFSTVGHANPVFTIVQISLRLAKHIIDTFRNAG